MATHDWTSAFTNMTVTDFRAWAQGLHAAILACGWAASADTGQVDLTTMTIPAVNATYAGYRVYASTGAGAPIVLRIDFGRGNAAATPGIAFTVGKGSDGSGAVTGVIQTAAMHGSTSTASAACYAGGDGETYLHVVFRPVGATTTGAAACFALHIERAPDDSGLAVGIRVPVTVSGPPMECTVAQRSGSLVTTSPGWPVGIPLTIGGVAWNTPTATASPDGVSAPVFPIPLSCPGVTPWVSRTMAAVLAGDAGPALLPDVDLGDGPVIVRAWSASSLAGTIGAINASFSSGEHLIPAVLWAA